MAERRPIDAKLELVGYVDSDWAPCLKTWRSFTGVCLRLAGGTITWKARLRPTIAGSSTETEFMGANDAGKTILFVRSIL